MALLGQISCDGQCWPLADFTCHQERCFELVRLEQAIFRDHPLCLNGEWTVPFRHSWTVPLHSRHGPDELITFEVPSIAITLDLERLAHLVAASGTSREELRHEAWWPKHLRPKVRPIEFTIRRRSVEEVEKHEGDPDWRMGTSKTQDGRPFLWAWYEADGLRDTCLDVCAPRGADIDEELRALYGRLLLGDE